MNKGGPPGQLSSSDLSKHLLAPKTTPVRTSNGKLRYRTGSKGGKLKNDKSANTSQEMTELCKYINFMINCLLAKQFDLINYKLAEYLFRLVAND